MTILERNNIGKSIQRKFYRRKGKSLGENKYSLGVVSKKLPQSIQRIALRKLIMIDNAEKIQALIRWK